MCVYIYIYICIRERERDTCVYIYIYIYIYTHTEKGAVGDVGKSRRIPKGRWRCTRGSSLNKLSKLCILMSKLGTHVERWVQHLWMYPSASRPIPPFELIENLGCHKHHKHTSCSVSGLQLESSPLAVYLEIVW